MSNALKKLASQTAVYGLSSIVGRLLNYLLTPLYTYSFTPDQYGVVVELYTYTSFLAVLLTYGMETAFFRFTEQKSNHASVFVTALISIFTTTLLFVFLVLIGNSGIANLLGYSNNEEYILWFAVIIFFDVLASIPFAKLRNENKALKFATIRIIGIAINILLNILLLVVLPGYFAETSIAKYFSEMGVGVIFIANVFSSMITFLLLLPEIKINFTLFSFPLLKEMLKYAFPLLIAGMAGMVNETMDRLLLKFLLKDGQNVLFQMGVYGACYKVAVIMNLFIQTYRYAAEPFFFQQQRKSENTLIYAQTMSVFIAVCMLIYIVTLLFIDYLKYFIGEEYRVGLHIVPILMLAYVFLGIFFNLSIWYKLSGKTKYGAYLTFFGAAITITANFILIPLMGYTGAAWATLLCYFLMMIASYLIGNSKFPVNYDLKKAIIYISSGILIFLIDIKLSQVFSSGFELLYKLFFIAAFLVLIFFQEKKSLNKTSEN